MRELVVEIRETSQYIRRYLVSDDFEASSDNLVELVARDDHYSNGDTGCIAMDATLREDNPVPADHRTARRGVWRGAYRRELDVLRRRFGDADVIDDRRGGDVLAAPYGDGMLMLRTQEMAAPTDPGPGWSGWYEDADGEIMANVSAITEVYNGFEQALNILLAAALRTRNTPLPEGWHQ